MTTTNQDILREMSSRVSNIQMDLKSALPCFHDVEPDAETHPILVDALETIKEIEKLSKHLITHDLVNFYWS